MLRLQNIILEMVAKGETLQATADRLCVEIERRFPSIVCSILRVDRGGFIHPLAAPSLPMEYSAALDGLAIGPRVGSCGTAAYLRASVAVTDIESDLRWSDYKAVPLSLGLRACWSSPICDGRGQVIGTFALYYREKRGPSDLERNVVDTCVHLCVIALERYERVQERERRAYIDALTELPNRACFNAALSRPPADDPRSWALLLLDLDNLKVVNDTFGHHTGDILLQTAAARIAEAAAPDTAFRLGGDEFAVIVQGPVKRRAVAAKAKAILEVLAAPAECDDHVVIPSATIGIAMNSAAEKSPDSVHRNADFALYHAKETNRGGFTWYAPHLDTTITHRATAARDVAAALASGRIDAHYQPIVDLATREIVGFEALCRLITESGDLVPAASFQEATSDARVATRLTRRMMAVVASDIRKWLDLGVPFRRVAINISSADLHGGELCTQLTETFGAKHVALGHLILEVTESVYMRERDHVVPRTINALRDKGLGVALDDFGTGFASLTHLLTVPVDILKIDKSFVDRLAPDDASSAVVEGLISIAHKLGIRLVAEGVETELQRSLLRNFGCSYGQGYLFAKPLHREAATALLMHPVPVPVTEVRRRRRQVATPLGHASPVLEL